MNAYKHGDHNPMPYDGHNSDLADYCQICGVAVNETVEEPA